jgi:ATP-dependent Clp protease ATP-binding subunit ClpA
MTNFDRFSERTRSALAYAHEEARNLNQQPIGTGHLLLGLLAESDGISVRALRAIGMDVDRLRGFFRGVLRAGLVEPEGESLSQPAKQALQCAIDESRESGSDLVEPEHVLLGLIRSAEGSAGSWLRSEGATVEIAREAVVRVRGETVTTGDPPESAHVTSRRSYASITRGASRFERFSERARKVLQLAQEEAQRFNHNYIGTEHLLLGLVREGDGVAARVLNNMGVQLPKVRSAVEFIIGRGEGAVIGDIGLTPRAKKVLELAVDEGRRLNHHYIGTEHLLLGLVREGEGIAAGVLESLGVNLEKVRAQVVQVLESLPEEHA